MRILTLDIGTNSTLFLIADVEGGQLRIIERGIERNGLGAGQSKDGRFSPGLIKTNRTILQSMLERGRTYGCRRVKAVGTHALRTASNGMEFLQMARAIGLDIEVIDGAREGELAWRGAFGPGGSETPAGLLDIGGGSSELTVGEGAEVTWSESLKIGAVTMTSAFLSDPPSQQEIEAAAKRAKRVFQSWQGRLPSDAVLVGVAGTVTGLASLEARMTGYQPGALDGLVLERASVNGWKIRLARMSLEERRALPGMPPARAEVILAGTILLDVALEILGRESIKVSERGVMFGLAWEIGNTDDG
jgi:exopolyphosphatase/guanosine-5'-triphosphate,3'-diphosphate pyrophosphatase